MIFLVATMLVCTPAKPAKIIHKPSPAQILKHRFLVKHFRELAQ